MFKMNYRRIVKCWRQWLGVALLFGCGWSAQTQVPPPIYELPPPKPNSRNPYQVRVPLRHAETKPLPKQRPAAANRRYTADKTLTWDAVFKEVRPKLGAEKGELFFQVSNDSNRPVTISQIRPSCGCTLTRHPNLPWTLKPGESDQIHLAVDLKGKHGTLTKSVSVFSSAGQKDLSFKIHISNPGKVGVKMMSDSDRLKNIQIAAKDRQAIFKGNCKSCHYDAALGKQGEDLFVAACGICHETPHRATMVPDLSAAQKGIQRNQVYWTLWITHGKTGTLMPAFHQGQGGPLTSQQIQDLAGYLTKRFPDNPPPADKTQAKREENR